MEGDKGRRAIKMRRLTRPPADKRQPTRQMIVRTAIDRATGAPDFIHEPDRPRRSGLLVIFVLLVLAIAATVVLLLRTSA